MQQYPSKVSTQICSHPPLSISHSFKTIKQSHGIGNNIIIYNICIRRDKDGVYTCVYIPCTIPPGLPLGPVSPWSPGPTEEHVY